MSASAIESATPGRGASSAGLDWGLIGRQIAGILRLEIRRNLFSRRSFALYFLAFAPVGLFVIWALVARRAIGRQDFFVGSPAEAVAEFFAVIFAAYLGTMIFLSALITFMSLFRSEILERSLHYYFLTPVRRWVLVAGKYCSALISSCVVFTVSTTALFILMSLPWGFGEASRYLFQGPGLGLMLTYIGIAILGCIGYGAVFLLVGLFFRNAIIPAAFIWGWEAINFVLPPLLQKISVIHYLTSLFPIPLPTGPFAVITNPTSPWVSVPGLVVFTILVLTFAGWRAGRMEISYGGD
ncbi:MAG: hypothetical protein AAF657_17455 [Acidobacteriota bacterium]